MTLPSFGQPIARLDIDLAALDGVVIAAPAAGDILVYDGVDTWRNRVVTGDITISALGVVAIVAGVIVDADISPTAEIQVSKLADGAARQILQTDAAGTGVEWTSNMDAVTIGATTPAPGTFNTLTKTGTTGLTWSRVSDEDYEIFFLSGVTGGPRWIWDEAGDRWSSNFGIIITNGSLDLDGQGSIQDIGVVGNSFGAAQLDLVAGFIILGADGLTVQTTAGDVTLAPAGGVVLNPTGSVGIGSAAEPSAFVKFGGPHTLTTNETWGLDVDLDLTSTAGQAILNMHQVRIRGSLTTADEAGATVLTIMSTVRVDEPDITLGINTTVTDAATVFIAGAPTEGVTSNSHLLFGATATVRGLGSLAFETAAGDITLTADGDTVIPTVNGINYSPGGDVDTSIITVVVTGVPTLLWDESATEVLYEPESGLAAFGIHSISTGSAAIRLRGTRGAAGGADIGRILSFWDTNNVAEIRFMTGSDTLNKDDGTIEFYTSAAASTPVLRVTIENNGNLNMESNGSILNIAASGFNLTASGVVFGAADRSITASSAGVARTIAHDITVGAGGAADAELWHSFRLDSSTGDDEAGMYGETNGAGGVTATSQIWKVPYRDSGASVAAPAAPNAFQNGGLRVEAGDDDNRLYMIANGAWHYISQTAGFSFLAQEPVTFGDFNNWHYGDHMVLKVDRYGDNGGHALPHPFSDALKADLLEILRADEGFRAEVKELVNT